MHFGERVTVARVGLEDLDAVDADALEARAVSFHVRDRVRSSSCTCSKCGMDALSESMWG